LPFKICYLSR